MGGKVKSLALGDGIVPTGVTLSTITGESTTVNLAGSGDFDAGTATLYLKKYGKMVFLTLMNNETDHAIATSASSAVGLIPAAYRPASTVTEVTEGTYSSKQSMISVTSAGQLIINYWEHDSASGSSEASTFSFCMAYNVATASTTHVQGCLEYTEGTTLTNNSDFVDYSDETVNLSGSGDYSAGSATLICARLGGLKVITQSGIASHPIDVRAISASTLVPEAYRPGAYGVQSVTYLDGSTVQRTDLAVNGTWSNYYFEKYSSSTDTVAATLGGPTVYFY
jgi:hypothetical protein